MSPRTRQIILRTSGVLLVTLGVLHLAVTPFIDRMLRAGATANAADWLTPPMLLNHVVVGILLLPLGVLIYFAAPHAAAGATWALMTSRTIAVAIAALPVVLWALMGTRNYDAPPFRIAVVVVCAAAVSLLAAAFWPARRQ